MREKFMAMLPFYVNGSIDDTDRVWFEQYLADNPTLQTQIGFAQALRAGVKERYADVSHSIGLAKSLARLDDSAARNGWLKRLFSGGNWLKPALACSMGLVAFQFVLLQQRPTNDQAEMRYRGGNPAEIAGSDRAQSNHRNFVERAYLSVTFRPTANEGQLRLLLIAAGGQMVAGPGLNGEYLIAFTADRVIAGQEQMRQSGLVVDAQASAAPH
jgi:hypothetical protein